MKLILSKDQVQKRPEIVIKFLEVIEKDINFFKDSYPKFEEWLWEKVIPGIYSGERTILIEYRDLLPVGVLIVKHAMAEKKICTLRVRPHFESRGLGVRLFETAFELLETERPLLSVSEVAMPKFTRLFDYFGFERQGDYEDLYIPKLHEFSFNGLLENREAGYSLNFIKANVAMQESSFNLMRRMSLTSRCSHAKESISTCGSSFETWPHEENFQRNRVPFNYTR